MDTFSDDRPPPADPPADALLVAMTAAAIRPPDARAAESAAARQGRLTKPPGALGRLEDLATRIAAIRGEPVPLLRERLVVVAAGDHGVATRGVSPYPQSVTAQMVSNFLAGGAAINVLADQAGARVRIVDAGITEEPIPPPDSAMPLLRLGLGRGTADISAGPAMSRAQAERAIASGIRLFDDEVTSRGVDIVACGEMGIGNTTSAAALIAAATGTPPAAVTGRGTGADDETYARKLAAVERALAINETHPADGIGLLAALGGFEIGVLAGVYLGAARLRIPAVMDGAISGAAALIAAAIAPGVVDYIIASHRSAEPGHGYVLEQLGLEPLFDLGLRLGEGSGAALGLSLCVTACRLLDEMATFEEAGVDDSDAAVPPES